MNDKQAFKEWQDSCYLDGDRRPDPTIEEAWKAAISYKQKEIDKLQVENKKLREALCFYANKYAWQGTHIGPSDYWFDDKQGYYFGGLRAREALKEVGEE
jgi:hypothetical protein